MSNTNKPTNVLDKNKKWLICPTCRNFPLITPFFENSIPHVQITCRCISSVQIFRLTEYLSLISQKRKITNKCSFTKEHSHYTAVTYCFNCNEWLCSYCAKNHTKLFPMHTLSDESITIDIYCPKHSATTNEEFVYYCKDCKADLCAACYDEHDHLHSIISLKEYFPKEECDECKTSYDEFKNAQSMKDEVKDALIAKINESDNETAKAMINEIERIYKQNKDINDELDKYIQLAFDNYYNTIESTPNYNVKSNTKCVSIFNLRSYEIKDDVELMDNINNFIDFYSRNYCIKTKDTPFEIQKSNKLNNHMITKICELPGNRFALSYRRCKDRLSFCSYDNNIEILASRKYHFVPVEAMILLNDGRLATGSDAINIWNLSDYDVDVYLDGHIEEMVTQLLQLPDGRLISSGADGAIKVWNINTRKCIHNIEAHTSKIFDIIMLKDGNVASCSSDNSIKIWNMKDYTCIKEIKNTFNDKEILKQMLLLKDGKVAVVCNNKSEMSVIRLLDTKEFTMNEEISFGEEGYVIKQIQQMEDGRLIVTGEKLMGMQMEKIGKVFDVDKKEMLFKLNESVEKPGMFIVLNNGKILIENDKDVVENEKKVLYKEFNILG